MFPFIQAAAHHKIAEECIERGEDTSIAIQVTSAVAAFLVWDELGAHRKILQGGQAALPDIVKTGNFHANMLQADIKKVLGKEIKPGNSQATRTYLAALGAGLAAKDDVERVAYMVAFERHAQEMINSLWDSLKKIFPEYPETLKYFEAHVGGDDPAEPHHLAMTSRMIELVVRPDEHERFFALFSNAYELNYTWCHSIKNH